MRKLLGWIMFALGCAGLIGDFHVAYRAGSSLHAMNAAISLCLVIGGLVALVPTLAAEIAKDLATYGKVVTSVIPGGRRSSDPPDPPSQP